MMKFGRAMLRAGLAVAALRMAGAAQAATVLITYTGTLTSGQDNTGVFGSVRSLPGLAFTAVYILNDPSTGATVDSYPGYDYRVGGSSVGAVSPFTLASLTIDGVSVVLGPAALALAELEDSAALGDLANHQFFSTQGETLVTFVGQNFGTPAFFLNSANYQSSVNYNLLPGVTGQDGFVFEGANSFVLPRAQGNFQVTSFSIGPISNNSAVPEPATWATMLAGFAVIGGALRRRSGRVRLGYAG